MSLEKSILATIAYFDIFDYPLTLVEIWQWLYTYSEPRNQNQEPIKIFDIQEILDNSDYLKKRLETKNGFYFLAGRTGLVEKRMERYNIAERKYKKALRIIKFLHLIPYVKMIAICNTLAYSNARDESDIDLFIICEKGHLWKTRFLISGFLKFFNLRPTELQTRDKICASFFLSEDNLDIRNLAINDDIYLKYWITQIYPVYDDGVYGQFSTSNGWVKNDLPNIFSITPTIRRQLTASPLKTIFRLIFSILPENYCKNYQWKILPDNLRQIVNKDTRVVMNDHALKFHDNDKRELFRNNFQQKLQQLI